MRWRDGLAALVFVYSANSGLAYEPELIGVSSSQAIRNEFDAVDIHIRSNRERFSETSWSALGLNLKRKSRLMMSCIGGVLVVRTDRKSTRLNSSHLGIS